MKSFVLFVGLLLSVSVSAEPLLEGQVRLESGAPAAGVQVRLFDLTNLHQSVGTTTDETGHFTLSLPTSAPGSALPQGFALGQNYPNPFNPSTIIPYQIPTATHVRLEVFNVLGQRVATLVDAERPAGFHAAQWTATDATGRAVGAGVYFYRLVSGGTSTSRRMVLIDGQAGMPAASAAGPIPASASAHSPADADVYGLTVSGAGVVAYVNPAFRVGVDEAEIVLEAASGIPRMKRTADGILGDVNNDGQVNASDALYVLLYIEDNSIILPNNGDISLGDLNKDGIVDFADAVLLVRYLADPSDPALPAGIGSNGETSPSSVIPPSPSNVRYEWDSSISQYRISWDPSPGATFYRVYYDGATFFSPSCPGGCDLIGTVADTSLGHYGSAVFIGYWVRACNDEGCSNYVRASFFASGDSGDDERESGGGGSSDDHSNTRPLATRLTPGSSLASQIETGGDVDYFKVQVGQAGTLTVHTTGRLDTKGTLENNAGSALETDDDSGDGNNFRIERAVSAGIYYVKVEGFNSSHTGSYTIHTSISSSGDGGGESNGGTDTDTDTGSGAPANVSYVREGSSIRVTWDAVSGAEYYKIYHDDHFNSSCRLNPWGSPAFCDELASNIQATSYVHTRPDDLRNYYWVVACNSGGCSDIDSENPATFIDTRPGAPANVSYVREGSSIRVTWDAVSGAEYYKIYHDDFFNDKCRLNSRSRPSFCDELASNIQTTSYVHTSPDDRRNYYWVVACNSGGCSDIDSENPAVSRSQN